MILGWETGTGKQEQGNSREANHDILSQATTFLLRWLNVVCSTAQQ